VAVVRSPLGVALLTAAVVLTVLAPAAAHADPARLREARAHYEQAVADYNLDEYAPALAEFREAYRIKPDPSFLFNIAQCHRKLGQNEAALDYYRKYLRNLPDAPNRADVERIVAELHTKETAPQPDATPRPMPTPAPVVTPTPAPVPRLEAPTPAPEASLIATPAAPPPPSSPIYKRWWFWTGVGVIVVSAAVIGVVASSKGSQPYVGTLGPNVPLEVK
jgi:tetratricopeptide (TPR) repeat protein